MYIWQHTTTISVWALTRGVQYYRFMCPSWSHVLAPTKEADRIPRGTSIIRNDGLEVDFCEIRRIVSSDTLQDYPYCWILLTVHINASDQQFVDIIRPNNKPVFFLSIRIIKTQRNYTLTDKKILYVVEFLKPFHKTIFEYKINALSDHKKLVYAATQREYQIVMH